MSDSINIEGIVNECLRATTFRIDTAIGPVLAKLSGRMRQHRIWLACGDRVQLEVSPYDPTRGRIVHRVSPAKRH